MIEQEGEIDEEEDDDQIGLSLQDKEKKILEIKGNQPSTNSKGTTKDAQTKIEK